MAPTSTYLALANWELGERAKSDGLTVDPSAGQAIDTIFESALNDVERRDPGAFQGQHRLEYTRTALRFAEEASKAARSEGVTAIGGGHVEQAVEQLRALKLWPFTEG